MLQRIRRTPKLFLSAFMTIAPIVVAVIASAEDGKKRDETPIRDFNTLPVNTWVKLSPLENTPVSPRLGYEGACVWDARQKVMIRYGGHNQGGGGEQNAEVWTFEPRSAVWTLKQPNTSPPGICCGQQNVYDPIAHRYIRFPAFSASHGWQWWREVYLNDSSVWTYDLQANLWRNMRPLPTANPRPLRCASWDDEHQVVVMFGGEGSNEGTQVYDPATNAWTAMHPKVEPAARSGGNMAYDQRNKVHILFGSQFIDDPHTWAYDLRTNTWRDMQPPSMPPTDKNDAVLTYDSRAGVVVAIVKITTGKDEQAQHRLETWTYNYAQNTWTKMNPEREPDPTSNRARQLMFAPELGVTLLENRPSNSSGLAEQQIWAYRLPALDVSRPVILKEHEDSPSPKSREVPPLVDGTILTIHLTRGHDLSWKDIRNKDVVGYHVERAAVEVLSDDQLKRLKSQTPPLEQPSVGAIRRIGPFIRLTQSPIKECKYTDLQLDLMMPAVIEGEPVYERSFNTEQLDPGGRPYRFAVYAYRVRAVNSSNLVGGASSPAFTIPSCPQFVVAKEDGGTCHLQWRHNEDLYDAIICKTADNRNPQPGSDWGYHVYRMDGRYAKDPIVRLTSKPIRETTFVDPDAGKSTRRYYVVAVDAFGQEGFPSSPVWFNREWQSFYKPYIEEWHQ
jgi:hypothetical protein